jgi:hypothetical protein
MGIAAGLAILSKGKVRWKVNMNKGELLTIEIEAFYCPKATQCLLCPQQLVKHLKRSGHEELVKVKVEVMNLVFLWRKQTL